MEDLKQYYTGVFSEVLPALLKIAIIAFTIIFIVGAGLLYSNDIINDRTCSVFDAQLKELVFFAVIPFFMLVFSSIFFTLIPVVAYPLSLAVKKIPKINPPKVISKTFDKVCNISIKLKIPYIFLGLLIIGSIGAVGFMGYEIYKLIFNLLFGDLC